jgi:hypothetical protein
VLREPSNGPHYFVSGDFYKTLLMIRAGEYGGHRGPTPPAIRDDRSVRSRALQEVRPLLTKSGPLPKSLTHQSLTHRIDDLEQGGYPPRSVVLDGHTETLLQRLGFKANAKQLDWLLTTDDDRPRRAADALEDLMKGQTELGRRMKQLEHGLRQELESETRHLLEAAAGDDRAAEEVVQEAADKIYQALPLLMLMPGGAFERALRQCLDQLDAAGASDNGHRDIDHLMQRQMRALEGFLKQQDRETYQSWAAVGEYLAHYDEQLPTIREVGKNA